MLAARPTAAEAALISGSALLTILSFPDFDLWFLAWLSLVPLLIVILRASAASRAFVGAWLWGIIFFYGTCWWLTYPMIHYGPIGASLAYPLLLLPVMLVALFPALFGALLWQAGRRFRLLLIIIAPLLWVCVEWLRYVITGQLWNALGYSQAFHPRLIQPAVWGGVYAVSFILVASNTAIASVLLCQRIRALVTSVVTLVLVAGLIFASGSQRRPAQMNQTSAHQIVIAIQPNVPMDLGGDPQQMADLLERHISLSRAVLNELKATPDPGPGVDSLPRLIIWPESPMNFSYARDPRLRETLGDFARSNQVSLLFNSLEPGRNGGDQNSAVLINEQGQIAARYDKIRLMPFGEYVPLPRWLPGASSVRAIVGEFTPGSSYTLMPLGAIRAGVFICIEAAHPGIARAFSHGGADVLINISNDGYLGPTPVMRQHLANAIFRAVENERPLLRVTNTGITAYISVAGRVEQQTGGFQEATRTWTIDRGPGESTFYTRHGDLFVYACALISLGFISASFMRRRLGTDASGVLDQEQ